jgi:molybdate transport system ATP-binding protein
LVHGAVSVEAAFRVALGTFCLSVDLGVADGEMLAVLGPNGAGKTTLLRALAGLLPIDDGSIRIDGRTVDDPATGCFVPPELRSVGVVFQDYLLFEHLSALDNVAFGLREHGVRRADARARARTLLAEVGVDAQASKRPRRLSGGQAQRVALARALAPEPKLLLLDEPLAALDVQTRAETRRNLRTMLGRFSGARVLVTHDPVDALALADRIVILEQGAVAQTGTPDEITSRPRSQYVAELVGVNLFRGRADGDHIRIGDAVVTAAEDHSGDVMMIIPPNAVMLHREQPSGSARNVWPGTVTALEHLGARGRVRVRIVGPLTIVAEVTPAAVHDLALVEGTEVWAAVKATEVEVFVV